MEFSLGLHHNNKFLMNLILIILASISYSTQLLAQDTTVIFINNQKAAQVIIKQGQTEALLQIKRSDYKKAGSFIIQVNGEHVAGELYKRSLEISDNGNIIEETKNKPGHFYISKKQFPAGKPISLYLIMDPANPRMKIPSKRIYLGNLVMK